MVLSPFLYKYSIKKISLYTKGVSMKKPISKLLLTLAVASLLLTSCSNAQNHSDASGETSNGSEVSVSNGSENSSADNSQNENSDDSQSESSDDSPSNNDNSQSGNTDSSENNPPANLTYEISYKENDLTSTFDENSAVKITCNGTSAEINGSGATNDNGVITVTAGGDYILTGMLNGRIVVNSSDNTPVRLILKGVSVTCDTSAPFYVASADKVIVTLADGTENSFTDCKTYAYDDATNEEPSAAIFSKDDLSFNGNGRLTVTANFKNGIQSKDKLKICGGTINITSANDGIKGKDCVGICGGDITVNAGGDGIQSPNADSADVGFVNISDGKINITSSLDGIQGESGVCISGGTVNIKSGNGGGSSTDSKKGIKGGNDVSVTGGTVSITASDDGLHSNVAVNIDGGSITLSSNDDGIHADSEINIKNGSVNITKSYEGIEAAVINISGGKTVVKSSDDGINASDGSGGGMGGRGGGGMANNSACKFNVSGGTLYVNASGDGLDSNGSIFITGGLVLCEGPTNGGNSSVDHNGYISITGGTLLSVGSSGMAGEILGNTTGTTQCVFGSYCNGSAGTTIAIKDSSGNAIFVFKTTKQFGHLVFSSPQLKISETYEIWTGGTGSGDNENGLYSSNSYNGGSVIASVEQAATVTGGGNMGGGMFPGGGGMNPDGGGMNPGGGTRPSKPGRW